MARVNNIEDFLNLGNIQRDLLSANPHAVMQAGRAAGELEQNPSRDIVVSVRTNTYKQAGEANDYQQLELSFPRLQIPTGTMRLKGTDPLAETVLNCDQTVVPVVINIAPDDDTGFGKVRWTGRVNVAHDHWGGEEADYIECELLHDKAWLTRIIAWSWWFMPIQLQGPPQRGVAFGPAVSVIKYIIASQALRLQLGMWDLVNNLGSLNLDFRSWFGTLLMADPGSDGLDLRDVLQAVTTPIYVVPSNAFFDTSPFISMNWRFDQIWELITKTLEDNGLTVEVDLWEPGMAQPDPFAELTSLLRVPTIVVDVKDRMQVTGFSGTFLDGFQRTFVDILDSAFGEALSPFLDPEGEGDYAPEGVNIAPRLGVHFTKPWVVFTDHRDSGVKGISSHHHPIAWRTITGGKSPAWMNHLIDATLAYLIDMLMIVIGFTGVPGTVLDGAFHDIAFAFMLKDNFNRRVRLGPYGFPESMHPTGSGSYTLEGFFAQMAAQYDTAGYVSGQIEVDGRGGAYEFGRDIFPGALSTYVRRGKIYTDFNENATLLDDREKNRTRIKLQIGDGKREEAPIAKLQRRLAKVLEGVNVLLMSSG